MYNLHANIGAFCEMAGTDKDVNFISQTIWEFKVGNESFPPSSVIPTWKLQGN